MERVLFVCHGSILKKSPEKARCTNDYAARKGAYCTTTTPFLKEPWMTLKFSNRETDGVTI